MPPRLNPCSILPRRLQIVATLTGILLFCLVFLGKSSTDAYDPYLEKVPFGPKLEGGVHQVVEGAQNVVDRLPGFRTPAHKPPPEQANSSSGGVTWYSDWKWKNPFSSDTVYDEARAVLPPLAERPPIYTYYDAGSRRKDQKSRKAEQELLQIWRRAWWAAGFRPVVLSKSEAMHNPLYRAVQGLTLEKGFEHELMRWLAWANMKGGILANFMAVPMATYDDSTLSFLRRGEYPTLSRFENLSNGLFIGSASHIDAALKEAISSPAIKRVKFLDEALSPGTVTVEAKAEGIAFYSDAVLKSPAYKPIGEKLSDLSTVPDALQQLPDLINSHLHTTWQNQFPKGIVVLKPLPEHTTVLIEPAIDLARNLSQCSNTPLPSSCPPNRPKCKPCVSNNIPISAQKVFRNDSRIFTIASVPHPHTITSLVKQKDDIDLRFIRRETDRDIWIQAATKEMLGNGLSSFARLPTIKEAVASVYGSTRSLWLTAEDPPKAENEKDQAELDWIFPFKIPREPMPSGKSETPVPGPERRPPAPKPEYGDGPVPTEADLAREKDLYEKALIALRNGEKGGAKPAVQTKEVIESWNLADAEAWKFVRAYNARRSSERREWEHEEASYQGKGAFDRWVDKIT
ncbi:hypothetical protein HII31_11786 [Pseudocercospora fuligena]|uniref:Uncharacterized protein n=1 Tax=Pseudocercospora fuligena TaxID=685502 RepID=A0A8H6R6G7_9PEZI|nr:hypothetical protein HII31_11786 [Pseudocercospora fuligena]